MALTKIKINIKRFCLGGSEGSLMPLSFGFFIIALSLLFVSININAAYSTKKELINLGEAAIQRAAHEMDTIAYYLELNRFSFNKKMPINCPAASNKFRELISQAQVSGYPINIDKFDCSLFEISAEISISGVLPVKIPMLGSENIHNITISAVVGANSPYQLS
jgi:hypothetical protein